MSFRIWAPALALLVGCGPASVSGVVDGERVGGARSALFDTFDFGVFGEAILVILTDIPDACGVLEDFYETIEPNCEETCESYMDIAEEHLGGSSYWRLDLVALADGSFETEYDYEEDALGGDEFQLTFYRYDAEPLYDQDECEDTCQDSKLLDPDRETGNGGDLEIDLYDSNELVRGSFEVDMGGDEDMRGSFKAEHCDMVAWLPFIN